MNGIIYKITCNVTGKCYIGQTIQRPEERWRDHKKFAENNLNEQFHFYRAIRKYGWENFTREIIESGIPTKEELNEREIYWIDFYNSYEDGYNSTHGGTLGSGRSKKVFRYTSEGKLIKTYDSAAAAARELGCLPEAIRNVAQGSHNYYHNEIYIYEEESIETRLKTIEMVKKESREISSNNLKKNRPDTRKRVAQLDLQGNLIAEFDSIKDASKVTGIDGSSISKVALGQRKTAKGFVWQYI